MIDGFWTVKFKGVQGGGVAVFSKGKILGGDSGYTYTGTYEEKRQHDQGTGFRQEFCCWYTECHGTTRQL